VAVVYIEALLRKLSRRDSGNP